LRERITQPENEPRQQPRVDTRVDLTGRDRLAHDLRDLAIEAPPPHHRLALRRRIALDPLQQFDLLHEGERDDDAAIDDMAQALERGAALRARLVEHPEQPFEGALERA